MGFRIETDTMGEIWVDDSYHWGAQTQRSLENFAIGNELMPGEIIHAFAVLKLACAKANFELGKINQSQCEAICTVCAKIMQGDYSRDFPLKVWQTGSGTQSNMNLNEVIAYLANRADATLQLHPNDQVNMSQSSNDTFPTAMNIAAALGIRNSLLPALERLIDTFEQLEQENQGILKIGRTHLQDATPITFSQEISAWKRMIFEAKIMIETTLPQLCRLAIGGTAVGTGLNAPKGFDVLVAQHINGLTGGNFLPAENKFHALTAKDSFVFSHGALKALAANLMKIANDIRLLASGPRCGIGEIVLPANEPGSSIMPGKVNPTQCEAVTMVAVQVMANDVAVGLSASQGQFQLNTFMPVCAYNFLQSVRLLTDVVDSFDRNCVQGLHANVEKMHQNLNQSLMLVTCLAPKIGYDAAAQAAKHAFTNNLTLKESILALALLSEEEYDALVRPERMV